MLFLHRTASTDLTFLETLYLKMCICIKYSLVVVGASTAYFPNVNRLRYVAFKTKCMHIFPYEGTQ